MLDHTKAAIRKTIEDFKKLVFAFNVLTNLSYIGYLIYAIVVPRSIMAINIILLCLSSVYFLFYLIATSFGKDLDGNKIARKNAKKLLKIAKKIMKVYSLGVMIYGLSSASENATAPYVILMALQLMFFLIGVVFDCIVAVAEKRFELFKTAIALDTKPVKAVGNFFKKISGKEVEAPSPPTQTQELLTSLVQEQKEENKAKKLKQRFEKKQRHLKKKEKDLVKVTQINETAIADAEHVLLSLPPEETLEPKKKKGWFRK